VTGPPPIPLDEFETAIDALDPDDLAAFVAELWAASGDAGVAPANVTVHDADGGAGVDGADAVAVVHPDADSDTTDADPDAADLDSDTGDIGEPPAGAVVTAADLRRRLLYGLSPADAESASERFLGTAARSVSYRRDPPVGTPSAAGTSDEPASPGSGSRGIDPTETAPNETDPTETAPNETVSSEDAAVATGSTSSGSRLRVPPDRTTSETAASRREPVAAGDDPRSAVDEDAAPARGFGGDASRNRVAVAVVVVVLLAAVAGAASLAGVPSEGDGTDRLGFGDETADGTTGDAGGGADAGDDLGGDDAGEASGADEAGSSPPHYYADGILGDGGDEAADADPTGSPVGDGEAAARATSLEPTCERAPLHVVQIQMNALRYNDPATNDGIRTTRRFASPQNRRAVSTFPQFVELFEGPNYAPMVGHDAVLYGPVEIDGDRATVRVVTYEDGSPTGGYEFRMRKIDSTDASLTGYGGGHDGCWMTDAVGVVSTDGRDGSGGTTDDSGDVGATKGSEIHGPPGT
jgi:hypothetical protein